MDEYVQTLNREQHLVQKGFFYNTLLSSETNDPLILRFSSLLYDYFHRVSTLEVSLRQSEMQKHDEREQGPISLLGHDSDEDDNDDDNDDDDKCQLQAPVAG